MFCNRLDTFKNEGSVMKYISSICSDVGVKKAVNQDAVLVRQAVTGKGNILFAAVCDGMGGLEKGELASSMVISKMSCWFEETFPDILYHDFTPEGIEKSWKKEIYELNGEIYAYGETLDIRMGTTLTMLLLVEDTYYICNVGDSRIYYLKEKIQRMTHDQSYVQHEIDMGRMTEEEALYSKQRNILLQCIGAGTMVSPDFYAGAYKSNSVFILCTDGFCHVITEQEIWNMLQPEALKDSKNMEEKIRQLVETVKNRKEEDNITVTLIHAV